MSCCNTQINARRNADFRFTYGPSSRKFTFSGMVPRFSVRRGETELLVVTDAATINGSSFVVVGDDIVLTVTKEDLALLDSATPDTQSEDLFYDITLTDGAGFENWLLGNAFILLGLNDDSSCNCNGTAEVSLGGQCVEISIEGGNLAAGMSVSAAELNEAVNKAEQAAEEAEDSAAQAASNGAAAGAVSGADAGAAAGSSAGAVAANLVVATKVDLDGGNISNEDGDSLYNTIRSAVWSEGSYRTLKERATTTFCILDGDGGADPTGANDSTKAIRQAVQSGLRVEIPRGTFVWDAAVDSIGAVITTHGQEIFGHGSGALVGNEVTSGLNFYPESRVLFTGTGQKIVRTRRGFRASASDPQDDPMSAALTVAADGVSLKSFAVELYCDYSNTSPSNLGDDWDVAIHNMCRMGYREQEIAILGYFRKYGRLQENTSLNKSVLIPGYSIPDRVSRGTDNCSYILPISRGPRVELGLIGSNRGPSGAQYYDQEQGLVTDNRGSFGASDTTWFAGKLYGPDHHSGERIHTPRLDGNHLLEPIDAPCNVLIDGWANNASQRVQGITFLGRNRFSTREAFHVRLIRANRVKLDGHIDYAGSTDFNYGSVTGTSETELVTLDSGWVSQPRPEYFGDMVNGWYSVANSAGFSVFGNINSPSVRGRPEGSGDFRIGAGKAGASTYITDGDGNNVYRVFGSGNFGPVSDATRLSGSATNRWNMNFSRLYRPGSGVAVWTAGPGAPSASASPGSIYGREDGAAGEALYVKELGDGTAGWTNKFPPRTTGPTPVAGHVALFGDDGLSVKTSGSAPVAVTSGTFDVSFAFDTAGDLAVTYTRRNGRYYRIGNLVHFDISLLCVPTYTTATGPITITGLPFSSSGQTAVTVGPTSGVTYPSGRDQLVARTAGTAVQLRFLRSGNTHNAMSTDSIPSGTTFELLLSGTYTV